MEEEESLCSDTNHMTESYLVECEGVDIALDAEAELMLWLRVELTLDRSMSPFPQDTLLSVRLLRPPMSNGTKFSSPEPTSTSDPPEIFLMSALLVQCHVTLCLLFFPDTQTLFDVYQRENNKQP